jgi:hypothetical protein
MINSKTFIDTNTNNKIMMNKTPIKKSNNLNIINYGYNLPNFDKYQIIRLKIDSSTRNTKPKNILSSIKLNIPNNPLTLKENSDLIELKCLNHNLTSSDEIILGNISGDLLIDDTNITFYNNSQIVKIEIINNSHSIFEVDIKNNDIFVNISNIKAAVLTSKFINNIPINLINKNHKIFLKKLDQDIIDINRKFFYIKLPISAELTTSSFTYKNSLTKLDFKSIANINTNLLNARYPLTYDNLQGFHNIWEIIDSDNIKIKIKNVSSRNLTNVGGNNIIGIPIKNQLEGYPNSNNYKVDLGYNINNISFIKLIHTQIPNSERLIKDFPPEKQNNKLYWQMAEDGDILYSLEIEPGNYNSEELITIITEKWNLTTRTLKNTNTTTNQSNLNRLSMTINTTNDIVTFNSFNIFTLNRAITKSNSEFSDGLVRIIVNHLNHDLEVGDKILLEGALSTDNIPRSVLNVEHIIESIVDTNNYIIKLRSHNPNTSDTTNGGTSIFVLTPSKFRLLFDKNDTLGNILGFRNVGNKNSITKFGTSISNNIPYDFDYYINEVGLQNYNDNDISVKPGQLQFINNDYILMLCDAIDDDIKINNISGCLSKIYFSSSGVNYDTFVQINYNLKKEKRNISTLNFKFCYPDGILYDFNNTEHSFILEIYVNNSK